MKLLTLSDIKLPVTKSESELVKIAEKKLGRKAEYFAIKKKSLDARDKSNLRWVYTVEVSDCKQKQEELDPLSKDDGETDFINKEDDKK